MNTCQWIGCGKPAVFAIYDQHEKRPEINGTESCEQHLGSLIGSVAPTEPLGPWMVVELANTADAQGPKE